VLKPANKYDIIANTIHFFFACVISCHVYPDMLRIIKPIIHVVKLINLFFIANRRVLFKYSRTGHGN